MFRQRFRQWWYDEGLITVIVLAVCIPLMLLAVGNSGGNKGARCTTRTDPSAQSEVR
jgi:hypothetical protein